jgi:hypothetical protein
MKSRTSKTQTTPLHSKFASLVGVVMLGGSLLVSGAAAADSTKTTASTSSSAASQQQRLQAIITKGDQEITRRLTTLGTLSTKINAATKLSASDKATLTSEVSTTTSGLTTLKATLDADTTVSAAHTDAESIYTEYRVYALVVPKVALVKVADDQQVVQGKLSDLSVKLQARITADQQAGKDVTSLQNALNDMKAKTTAAAAISSSIETSVINLQPTDYNSNHELLSGDNTQLKTAHSDDMTATADAKTIVTGLKAL